VGLEVGDWTDEAAKDSCPVAFCQYRVDGICLLDEEFAGAVDAEDFYYVPGMENCLEGKIREQEAREYDSWLQWIATFEWEMD
jgi:hypothetical protein